MISSINRVLGKSNVFREFSAELEKRVQAANAPDSEVQQLTRNSHSEEVHGHPNGLFPDEVGMSAVSEKA